MRFDWNQVNQFILAKQHLAEGSKINTIVQVVRDVGGLHAQIPATPYLSLFERIEGFSKVFLDEELYTRNNLGRIKSIRKTVYIFPEDMICAAFTATRRMLDIRPENYVKHLGLTRQEYESVARKILKTVAGRGMTAKEIQEELGADLKASPIVSMMLDQCLLIRGKPKAGWKSSQYTYYPFSDVFPYLNLNAKEEAEARKAVVIQYLVSFGPVTENDIVWWTGFPKREIRQIIEGLRGEMERLQVSNMDDICFLMVPDRRALEKQEISRRRTVNLLPVLDSYIMGYKERKRYLDYSHYDKVFDFNGNATSTIILDGKIIGVWDTGGGKKRPVIKIFFFEKPESSVLLDVLRKAGRTGRFIFDKEVEVTECKSMISLNTRTAGGYLSPLRDS